MSYANTSEGVVSDGTTIHSGIDLIAIEAGISKSRIVERTNGTPFLSYCPAEAHSHINKHGRNSSNMGRAVKEYLGGSKVYEVRNQKRKHPESDVQSRINCYGTVFLGWCVGIHSRIKSRTLDDDCDQFLD